VLKTSSHPRLFMELKAVLTSRDIL